MAQCACIDVQILTILSTVIVDVEWNVIWGTVITGPYLYVTQTLFVVELLAYQQVR